VRKGEMQTDRK
jgi:hypothetical protein